MRTLAFCDHVRIADGDRNIRLSQNFKLYEFDCEDGTPYPHEWIEPRLLPLVDAIQKIRETVGHALWITSGYRTPAYNVKVPGASENSLHIQGLAADIHSRSLSGPALHAIILQLIRGGKIADGGVGRYSNFVHYDLRGLVDRPFPARWKG